jgi:tetratricopeptide (TPR) repeat protein
MSNKIIPFPNLVQMYLNKAEIALQDGNFENAEKMIEQVLDLDADNVKALYLYSLLLLQTERLAETVSLIDEKKQEGAIPIEWEESFQWIYEVAKEDLGSGSEGAFLDEETLKEWRKGLQSESYEVQWKTYEMMFQFIGEEVQKIIGDFLLYKQGDSLLKTKLLQKLKLNCPHSLQFKVQKENQIKTLRLIDVPVEQEEWSEEHILPYQLIQDKAHDDPSLVQMAEEIWIYFLEKHYPFIPQITDALKWTAALHFYTLKIVDEPFAEVQLREKFVGIYQCSEQEIREHCQIFESLLLRI